MFNGSIVALVTPFSEQGEIDFSALCTLVDFHLGQGTNGLVIAGTTGESVSLTESEFGKILDLVVERVAGRIPVLAGTGNASTHRSIAQTRLAADHGANAVLVVTPYYNRPPQRGLEAHFRMIADASELPVVLYNVPSRTAIDILPETVARLSQHEKIVGIKEAVGDYRRVLELRAACDESFIILSGDDHSCLSAMKNGANGVVSVAANVAPAAMAELCSLAGSGEWAKADSAETRLKNLFEILMIETNPIPVKWSLFEMSLIGPHIRLPMTRLGEEFREPVRQCLKELKLIPA
jgi:4-hydroxy-tetrahydrodipicolinate synthase